MLASLLIILGIGVVALGYQRYVHSMRFIREMEEDLERFKKQVGDR